MSDTKTDAVKAAEEDGKKKVGIGAYIALIVAIVLFSGVFAANNLPEGYKWLSGLDYSTLLGKYGAVKGAAGNFVGAGGAGARGGFLFALSLVPGVMFALGLVEVLAHYGAIRAAQVIMTPLLYPVLGLPGTTGLALITDLQSTDAGAGLTKALFDDGMINKKQLTVMCAWQYAGAGLIGNYLSTVVGGLITWFLVPIWIPFVIMLGLKFVGGAFVRLVLNTVYRKDFANE